MLSVQEIRDSVKDLNKFIYNMEGEVPANDGDTFDTGISTDSIFCCEQITGSFTTLTAVDTDGGVSTMSGKLSDNGRPLPLFSDFIDFALWLSPGRSRSSGVAGDPSNALFYPIDFGYAFMEKSTIQLQVKNSAPYKNSFKIAFIGYNKKLKPQDLIL